MPNVRVLIIAGDFKSKKEATTHLFENDCEALPVSNIKTALDLIRIIKPTQIVCKTHLPDGDVDHLLHTMKGSPVLSSVPVIVMGDEDDRESEGRVMDLGASAYLTWDKLDGLAQIITRLTITSQTGSMDDDEVSISGQLAQLGIVDLIRQMVANHGSGTISLDGPFPMKIHLRDGNVIHAEHGITIGKKALFRCLCIADAAFHFGMLDQEAPSSLEGELETLLEEARNSNQKLMANYYKLPKPNHHIRILNPDELKGQNLRPEAMAALEVIKRYPRVSSYLDRLNLSDLACYEYLFTFLERGWIEIVTEQKPLKIITDATCTLSADQLEALQVEVLPLNLMVEGRFVPHETEKDVTALLSKKAKVLEGSKILPPDKDLIGRRFVELLGEYDCLSLLSPKDFSGILEAVSQVSSHLQDVGHRDKRYLATELVTLDCNAVSTGLGLLVEKAVGLASSGHHPEQIEAKLRELSSSLHMLAVTQAGKGFLRKGNSAGLLTWDGKAYQQAVSKMPRGQEPQDMLVQEVKRRLDDQAHLWIAIGHLHAPEAAEALKGKIQEEFTPDRLVVYEIGPIVGHRLGEGALEVAFFQES